MMTKLLWSLPIAAALATVSAPSRAQSTPPVPEPAAPAPPAPTPTDVRLDLVNGEVKLLALDDTKSWTIEPQGGLLARAVDEGHTLRLVAQKDGIYTVRLEHNDGSIAIYSVHVGKDSSPGPAVPGPPPPPAADAASKAADRRSADEHYYANTIDLNLEGGAGRHFGDDGKTVGFGRARVGLMLARWPVFTMIGATYEYSNLAPAAFGIQGELLHLSAGFWGQLGAEIDTHAKAGVMAALGFSVVGVEAQYRGYQADDGSLVTGFAVLGKIRIPLGVILYAVDKSRNHH